MDSSVVLGFLGGFGKVDSKITIVCLKSYSEIDSLNRLSLLPAKLKSILGAKCIEYIGGQCGARRNNRMANAPNSPDAPQGPRKLDAWWGEELKKLNEQLNACTSTETEESDTTPLVATFVPRRLKDSPPIDKPEESI